uniref:Uncharacterized protein n=1 Tax=Ananas comosus var. bracteatus TaxID=296719 RepID=A0A6V7P9L8_ANACO|nr:unnamed protein product [Ananas comosus var. bracteatus]
MCLEILILVPHPSSLDCAIAGLIITETPCFPESLLTLNPLNLLKLVTVQNIIIRPQAGSCGGAAEEEEGCRDDAAALRLKLAVMAAILVAGIVGVAISLAAKEKEGCRDDAVALRLKLAAMAAILVAGMVGVAIPLAAGRKRRRLLSTESGFFALAKAFAAGVILTTGFVHMLHDAEAALTDPCLPRFPGAASPSPASSHGHRPRHPRHPRPRLPRHLVLRAQRRTTRSAPS